MRKIFLLLSIIIFLFSCQKDENGARKIPNCKTIYKEISKDPMITYFQKDTLQFQYPCFNPNNGNEIIYQYRNFIENRNEIVKYNILTHEKSVILSLAGDAGQLLWSSAGWVSINKGLSGGLWIVRDNGDNLMQIEKGNVHLVRWDNNGVDIYMVKPSNTNDENNVSLVRYNVTDGTYTEVADWGNYVLALNYNDNRALVFTDLGLGVVLDIWDFRKENFYTLDLKGLNGGNWSWYKGDEIFLTTSYGYGENTGLFIYNVVTQQYKRVFEFCQSANYTCPTYSPHSNRLFVERIDSRHGKEINQPGATIKKSTIVEINLNTWEEIPLDL